MMKTYLRPLCVGIIITNLFSSFAAGQEKADTKKDATTEEKSIREGINDRFKAADLSVEEFLKTFEVESREVYSKRNAILEHINLRPGQNVIDLGAGTGFYTFLFAEAVGADGNVLALDIAPAFINSIREKADAKNLQNVKALVSSDINFDAEKENYDLVFLCDVYHHIEYPQRINRRIVESLRKGGRLVIIDFERVEGKSREWVLGHVRAGSDVVRKEIEDSGLVFKSQNDDLLEENYIMIFEKP